MHASRSSRMCGGLAQALLSIMASDVWRAAGGRQAPSSRGLAACTSVGRLQHCCSALRMCGFCNADLDLCAAARLEAAALARARYAVITPSSQMRPAARGNPAAALRLTSDEGLSACQGATQQQPGMRKSYPIPILRLQSSQHGARIGNSKQCKHCMTRHALDTRQT